MLVQLWPNVNTYMRDMIKTTIEPKIQETLTLYKMNGFQFDRLRFGTIVRHLISPYLLTHFSFNLLMINR